MWGVVYTMRLEPFGIQPANLLIDGIGDLPWIEREPRIVVVRCPNAGEGLLKNGVGHDSY